MNGKSILSTHLHVPDTERECHRLKAFPQEDNRSASGSRLCEWGWREPISSRARIYTLRNMREGRNAFNRVEPRITSSLRGSYPFCAL